ncbi:MAG: alpha-amylase [Bacteroidales bacterium]|nr:alpha-amylase [Bacteroidales bacterium]
MRKIYLFIAFTLLLNGLLNAQNYPQWLKDAVFYQIYPSSFKDSDSDGIGDLNGITEKLDYIQSLGVNALWLNPIFESGWLDGGYDVIDFFKTDKRFGNEDDFQRFIDSAHAKGIRVCLDLVAGHTSKECLWYKQSAQGDIDNPYYGFYIFTDSIADDELATLTRRHLTNDPQIATWGSFGLADCPHGKYYRKNFFEFQPALNYGFAQRDTNDKSQQSPYDKEPMQVRKKMKEVMAYWFDKGVDGFRVDMASSLIKNDPDKQENIKLWQDFRAWLDNNYPDKVLIAEWSNPQEAIEAGFHIDFMIHFGIKGYPSLFFQKGVPDCGDYDYCYFDKSGKGSIKEFAKNFSQAYFATKDKGFISLPSGNHDFVRINCGTRNDFNQLKTAMTFFLTMPGVPFIYYGDEIGLKYQRDIKEKEGAGKRAGTRTPMQWSDAYNAGFSLSSTENLYYPVDTENGKITVKAQEKDPSSLLNFTKRLIWLRKTEKALANDSDWMLLNKENVDYPLVYQRADGQDTVIIAINPSKKKVKFKIPYKYDNPSILLKNGNAYYRNKKQDDYIYMNGVSSIILKKSDN